MITFPKTFRHSIFLLFQYVSIQLLAASVYSINLTWLDLNYWKMFKEGSLKLFQNSKICCMMKDWIEIADTGRKTYSCWLNWSVQSGSWSVCHTVSQAIWIWQQWLHQRTFSKITKKRCRLDLKLYIFQSG